MSSISVNTITDASGGATTSINGFTPSVSNMAGRNRIINGAMVFDQRNAGAAVTGIGGSAGVYTLDRFRNGFPATTARYSIQQVADAPEGFYNSLKVTITTPEASLAASSASAIGQILEGFNCYDLKTSGAQKPTAFSFWVKSSKTGTYIVEFGDIPNARGVSASYTINSVNTWEYKTIPFPADTAATWTASNASAGIIQFMLFAGSTYTSGTLQTTWSPYTNANRCVGQSNLADTNGATWQITGVQLEAGSVATPFEHRQYGSELALCQRYFQFVRALYETSLGTTGNIVSPVVTFSTPMRANPTITASLENVGSGATIGSFSSNGSPETGYYSFYMSLTISTAGYAYRYMRGTASAEL